jgi:hypothetical protein
LTSRASASRRAASAQALDRLDRLEGRRQRRNVSLVEANGDGKSVGSVGSGAPEQHEPHAIGVGARQGGVAVCPVSVSASGRACAQIAASVWCSRSPPAS